MIAITPVLIGSAVVLALGTFGFRLAGPLLRDRVHVPPRLTTLLESASVVLLVALVATLTLAPGGGVPVVSAGYALPAGVLAGGVLAWLRAPFLVVVLAAAAVAAGLRLLGVP